MLENNLIGNRIRELRKLSKLTMSDLAKSTNSSSGYISDLENGKLLPGIEKLISICRSLNISLNEFFNTTDIATPIPQHFKDFYKKNSDLTPSQLEALDITIKALKKD